MKNACPLLNSGGGELKEKKRNVLDRRSVPFVMVTKSVLEDESLKAADKSVYSVLCMYADNRTSDCYPSRETLLKKAGISDNTLRNSIRKLQDSGYIDVKKRYNSAGRASNLYVLLDVNNGGTRHN